MKPANTGKAQRSKDNLEEAEWTQACGRFAKREYKRRLVKAMRLRRLEEQEEIDYDE